MKLYEYFYPSMAKCIIVSFEKEIVYTENLKIYRFSKKDSQDMNIYLTSYSVS
jgi:hypothetical protein